MRLFPCFNNRFFMSVIGEYIFRLFQQHKVARQVLVQLVEEKLKMPAQIWGGPRHDQIYWKEPDFSDLIRLFHNPTYAGAYVYGQYEYDDRSPTNGKAKVHPRPWKDWPVCLTGVLLLRAVRGESADSAVELVSAGEPGRAAQRLCLAARHRLLRTLRLADERPLLLHQGVARPSLWVLLRLSPQGRRHLPVHERQRRR